MNYESILIVTYGRSGSTLLQGLLNSIPGVLIRGENWDFCRGLFDAYKSLCRSVAMPGSDGGTTHPWFGGFTLDPEAFIADLRPVVLRQLRQGERHHCVGFKEIRYFLVPDFAGYISFLERLFPSPAFVFLTRDLEQVAQSGWWRKKERADVVSELSRFEGRVRPFLSRSNWLSITYQDMIDRNLAGLFDFLGADHNPASVQEVLSITHSSRRTN